MNEKMTRRSSDVLQNFWSENPEEYQVKADLVLQYQDHRGSILGTKGSHCGDCCGTA
jgi:hypothetical protein